MPERKMRVSSSRRLRRPDCGLNRCSFPQHDWVDRDAVLVNQAMLGERGGEIGAAEDQDRLTGLRLELRDGFSDTITYQPRALPADLGQRGRKDDLDRKS